MLNRGGGKVLMDSSSNWLFWAILSAVFAALIAIFATVGLEGVNSDFATPPFLYIEREMPGIKPIITMKEILGENGTIGTAATTTRFRTERPELYRVLHAALTEAMAIIAADKGRAVDGYLGATGDKKTARDMLLKIANDPDVEFTMTPRAMKAYADFMFRTGSIKRRPESWKELFFSETGELNGS